MSPYVVLPALCLALWTAALHRRGMGRREALLTAATGLALLVVLVTELLSVEGLLKRPGVVVTWVLLLLVSGLVLRPDRWGLTRPKLARPPLRELPRSFTALVLAVLAGLAGVTFVVAVLAPQTSNDSIVFHLPRLEHWLQQGSVAFYPTTIQRQLWEAPFAEYAMLHLQALGGGPALVNLVQWAAALGAVVGITLITRKLGGGRRAQALAALVWLSAPMVLMQTAGTQTDIVVSFWCVVAAYSILEDLERRSTPTLLRLSAAVGLACLTKGTAYLVLGPAIIVWALLRWRRARQPALRAFAVLTVVFLALNGTHLVRNQRWYGHPLGDVAERSMITNERIGVRITASNLLRDAGSNFVVPSETWGTRVHDTVVNLHRVIGIDASAPESTFFRTRWRTEFFGEDLTAGNPVQVVLVGLALVALVALDRDRRRLLYGLSVVLGILAFATLVRWQPWVTRLELPFFAVASPIVAMAATRFRDPVAWACALLCVAVATPWLLVNRQHPLVGSKSVLHSRGNQPAWELPYWLAYFNGPYEGAMGAVRIREARVVGLVLDWEAVEYPFWRGLPGVRLESARTADWTDHGLAPPHFDAIICVDVTAPECVPGPGWAVVYNQLVKVLAPLPN